MYPEIRFTDSFSVSTYYLVISAVVLLCLHWTYLKARTGFKSLQLALNGFAIVCVSGLLGSRFLHVIYEGPQYYFQNPLEVFAIWRGGYVFLGGALFSGAALYYFLRKKGENALPWFDFFTPMAALGYGLGRIACFLAGCCYGRICDNFLLGVHMPHLRDAAMAYRHPAQLYAMSGELLILLFLLSVEKYKKLSNYSGAIFFLWITLHGVNRMLMELVRDDDRGPALIGNLSISFLISLILCLVGVSQLTRIYRGGRVEK